MLLNLLQLLQSDDQQTYTDKVNYNFDQILSMGGGPIGPTGFTGIQGVPGAQGIMGFQGLPGLDGSRWYVLPSTSTPSVPTPKIGDLWLQTDTLAIYEFLGSPPSWINLGFTLTAPGVFTTGGTNNLLFTNPSPLRSLVLSPINYGIGNDSPGFANYRLKIIGTSGSPMLRFGIDDGGAENSQVFQPTMSVQKLNNGLYPSSLNWKFNLDNLNGDVFINLNGNYFGIYPQISSVSRFDFGAQVRLQNNAVDRLLSFAVGNTGVEYFHIGRHGGISTTTDRLFSVKDNGQISIGDAFSNPIGSTTYHIDSYNDDLPKTGPPAPIDWFRLRGRVQNGGSTFDMLTINHNRLFSDTGTPAQRSTMIKIQHNVNTSTYHFVGFTGGADTGASTFRPQLRLGYTNGYYLAADVNGRIGIGDTAFIQKWNTSPNIFHSKLTVQGSPGITTESGGANWSGIHLIPQNATNSVVGITAGGIGSFEMPTFAGIHFKDESAVFNQGIDMHFGTGLYTDGGETRRSTITRDGNHYWWSKSDPTNTYLLLEPGGMATPNDVMHMSAYNQATNKWKSILFNRGTDFTGYGDGFVGIGGELGFGDTINASTNLASAQWYVALTNITYTIYPFIGFPFSGFVNAGELFTSATAPDLMNLDTGSVSRAKPQSKLHVNESVTFGTRKEGLYSTVGYNTFTFGNNNQASGIRSAIIGGQGHTSSGTNSIILGYSGGAGVTMPDNNINLLATTTHVSVNAPTPITAATIFTSGINPGMFGVYPQYRNSSLPILNLSSVTTVPMFGITGQVGDLARVLTLEGRTNNGQLGNTPVALEFHIRNASAQVREIAAITAMYYEPSPGVQRGRISFNVNMTPTLSGSNLYEMAYFSADGLVFIGQDIKPKIRVEANAATGGPGFSFYLTGGAANATGGAANGGNIFIDAGQGQNGGVGGTIALGSFPSQTSAISVGSGSVSTVTVTGAASVTSSTSGGAAVALSGADVAVTGNLRHMRPTWESFSVSSFVNGSGGAGLTVIADNVKVHHNGGTSTTAVTLFSFVIDAVPYDRIIYWLGGSDANIGQSAGTWNAVAGNKGQIFFHLYRSPFGGGDIIQRTYTTMYGGGNFMVPANQAMKVVMETGPIEGVRSLFSTNTGHDFIFRQVKFGL